MPSPAHPLMPSTPRLAILDHRQSSLETLRAAFRALGWKLRSSSSLAESLALLDREDFEAVIVVPLTLRGDGLEWENLRIRLSPARPLPWLLLPWEDVPPGRIATLLESRGALADWLPWPPKPAHAEARIRNLLRLQRIWDAAQRRTATLEGQLITDHKTGLANDRHFRRRLEEEFERTRRHGSPLTLILLDLDDFKAFNDEHSYEFGDQALRALGEVLRGCLRSIDLPARIGGDEYAILLPATGLEDAVLVARRIQAAAQRRPLESEGAVVHLRLSQGIATFRGTGIQHPQELFLAANQALKEAKKGGKGRIRFRDPTRPRSS